jgi:hypothetical protein
MLVILAPVFLLGNAAYAQTAQTGALKGTITDPTGSVVQGVTVKASSKRTGQVRTTITQSNDFSALGRLLSGWSLSGVTTFQSGQRLTVSQTNAYNAFGIYGFDQDRVQVASGCQPSNLVNRGAVDSRLNGYFNNACFVAPSVFVILRRRQIIKVADDETLRPNKSFR